MPEMNDFYVGYAARVPERLRRSLYAVVAALVCITSGVALLLVFNQQPFADSRFEYQQNRDYTGWIELAPYPTLVANQIRYLLVAPGKHGARDLLSDLDLRAVQLSGSLIQRGDYRMLEVVPGSIHTVNGAVHATTLQSLGDATFDGEIVDSKCYLGVMNPGNGKVHRDCAVRCISGGIPPALIVKGQTILLHGLGNEVLTMVAQPVRVNGRLFRHGSTLALQVHQLRRME